MANSVTSTTSDHTVVNNRGHTDGHSGRVAMGIEDNVRDHPTLREWHVLHWPLLTTPAHTSHVDGSMESCITFYLPANSLLPMSASELITNDWIPLQMSFRTQ